MDCSVCQFLRDALYDIDHLDHYPYPRTKEHREGVEDLAIRHYRRFHPNPFKNPFDESHFMNRT